MIPSPTDAGVFTALGTFLVSILPAGAPVIKGQVNRVPEPRQGDYVVMWELRRERIELNVDSYADVVFIGSITGAFMTVASVQAGVIELGATVFGVGVTPAKILTQVSGPSGGAGTYTIDQSQSATARTLSSGAMDVVQNTKVVIQCDVHGPNSADNAQIISTLLRDGYGVQSFADQSPNYGVTPLFTEDPRQMPFVNAEQAYEDRYVVEIALQVNPIISVPQQFADAATVEVISVDATFPPT